MPIDPNIITQGLARFAQPEDSLTRFAKVQALQNGIQQREVNAQQLQAGALDLQQKQKQITGQMALDQAIQKNLSVGQDGTPSIDHGGVTQALGASGQGHLIPGYMTGVAAQIKAQAEAKELQLKNQAASLELASRSFGAANDQSGWDNALATAHGLGIDSAKLGISATYSPENKAAVVQFGMTVKDKLAAQSAALTAQTRADAENRAQQKDARLAPGETADTNVKVATGAATLADPKLLNPGQRVTADQAGASAAETARRDAASAENAAGHLRVAQGELGLNQKKFNATIGAGLDANGQPIAPDAMKALALQDPIAVKIANYEMPPPITRGGATPPILRKVVALNPTYDGTTYPARSKTAIDFSPAGKSGQAITSTDTALAHLDAISQAGAALKNTDIKVLNRIANELGAQVGGSARQTYDTIVRMVAPEISKAVIGAAGGEHERQDMAQSFSSSTNDATRESSIGAAAQLLGARFAKSSHAYESEMGRPLQRQLSPESKAVLERYSGKAAVGGSVPHVTSKAQFDALPSGSVYTEDDGKQYRKP